VTPADRSRRRALAAGLALAALPLARLRAQEGPSTGSGNFSLFVPTPDTTVQRMLEVAAVGPRDYLVDLGSGDGRIVIVAAQKYGARGFGIDIDSELVVRSRAAAEQAGVAGRVRFEQGDVLQADLRGASVVTMYLFPELIAQLQPKLLMELCPGARIVVHDFSFPVWEPDASERFHAPDKYFGTGGDSRVSLWIVPAVVAGAWRVTFGRTQTPLDVRIRQTFQVLEIQPLAAPGRKTPEPGKVHGEDVMFALEVPAGRASRRLAFTGSVAGESMQGSAQAAGAAPVEWHAQRLAGVS
jgi:hypothetical protein